jgi:small subunit ribosomal protein S20
MATHKSAIKAHAASVRRRDVNRANRTKLRSALKKIRSAAESGDTASAEKLLPGTVAFIDKCIQKGILHENAAARHKSRLTRLVRRTASSK